MTTLNPLNTVPTQIQKEMKEMLGLVPSFARTTTTQGIELWWSAVRDFQLSDQTALEPKVKELIGLGVASQIPCQYCVLFHTEAARLLGATNDEIQESIFMAGLTRLGSTILNGANLDPNVFEKELTQMIDYMRENASEASGQEPIVVTR